MRAPPGAAVVTEGMRQALVRATGRRDAAADPALGAILQNAAQYLKGSRALPGGAVLVNFDGVALGQAIVAAGGNLWDSIARLHWSRSTRCPAGRRRMACARSWSRPPRRAACRSAWCRWP